MRPGDISNSYASVPPQKDGLPTPSRCLLSEIGRNAGLPSGQVHNSAPGSHGTVLMSTPAGLAVQDGISTLIYTAKSGLSCDGLRCVSTDGRGRAWIGSDIGFDVLDTDGTFLAPAEMAQPGMVTSCLADSDGAWIASASGLYRGRVAGEGPGRSVVFEPAEAGLDSNAFLVAADGRGRPIVADASNILHRWDGRSWEPLRHGGYRAVGAVKVISADTEDSLLIGGSEGFCRTRPDGDLLSFVQTRHLGGAVTALHRMEDRIFAAVGPNLLIFSPDDDGAYVPSASLLRNCPVSHMWADASDNVWVSTVSQGMIRISGLNRYITFPTMPDIGAVFAIRRRRSGALIIAGERGVLLPTTGPDAAGHKLFLPGVLVWDVLEDRIGGTIVATDEGVLVVDSMNVTAPLVRGDPLLAERARALLKRSDGIWIGTIKGLARFDGESVHPILDPDGEPFGYVYSLSEDSDGRLWMTTLGRGVWHESDTGIQRFIGPPLRHRSNAYALAESPDGRLAILADSTLYLGRRDTPPDEWLVVPLESAPWSVAFGDYGELLIGSSDGLMIRDAFSGELLRSVRPALGGQAWEFTTSRTLSRQDDGALLCGLSCGLAEIDVNGLRAFADRPAPYLAGIEWTGTDVESRPHAETDIEHLVVKRGTWAMLMSLRSDWRFDEEECRFCCRLIGFDADWLTPSRQGDFRYTSLPPGDYHMQGQVHSPLAGWGPVTDLFTLEVN